MEVNKVKRQGELEALGEQYPRYGYLMLHSLLRTEEQVTNRMRTRRLYTESGMQVRTKHRKKLLRPWLPMTVPRRAERALVTGLCQ